MNHEIEGITEEDIALYLANSPDFFERHQTLLSSIELTSSHGRRAVSLQERQMEMLRTKIKGLEQKIMEIIRNGQDNEAIAQKLHQWALHLLQIKSAESIAQGLIETGIKDIFSVPQVALKVWNLQAQENQPWSHSVPAEVLNFANNLTTPYCGLNAVGTGFSATKWLEDATAVQSIAMISLRQQPSSSAFGLLVFGSEDADRFTATMSTRFLARIGELSSACISPWIA